ncbi:LysE family translocator [Streptantibioticus rubrisoli]|uniref:LysE family translocator n=1 Tax=Streptantibioticus rubrisoli TaxID=1387313 RepID=A0ABT1P638_9ACTN|nr:LysE family translocator [Streptantibioticus rubrisoli]MCQ4040836.1 LysE family translocator [Streptantibioticus rubrisoli]
MLSILLPFLGACVVIAAVPGPSTAMIIRHSLRGGRRAGFATVLGNETGVFLWGVAAAFGLTALLAASQLAYDVMRYAGAAVLIWFGVQALRAARRPDAADGAAGSGPAALTPWRAYRTGVWVNLANPKAAIFAMSFLPQFVPHGAPQLPTVIGLATVQALFEVAFYGTYVWFVHRMKSLFDRASVRRRMERISGAVLLALGLRLALEG